ncbi:hypothetical protein BX666DRAFT_2112429 [Dichotomocladium elegans]|nr:hypothetical protein BX666DRAFT_2112429 [Dichotomocladium elegans]
MAKKIQDTKKQKHSAPKPIHSATTAKTAGVAKQKHKRRVKGTSELDNPKYASMDFMLEMIDKTSEKVEQQEAERLARRAKIEKVIEEKQGKRDKKKEERQEKLTLQEKAKKQILEKAKSKSKTKNAGDKHNKSGHKNKKEESEKPPKKRVRFA